MVMFSRQGRKGQSWHQDCPPEDPNRFNLNRLAYTHDITEEIGGYTVVVPGTHKKGLLPAGEPEIDLEAQVILKPKKGTLVLLHGHTWHRVLPVHGRYRVSTNFRASPKGVPADVTDVCVYRNMRYRFSSSEVIEERTPPRQQLPQPR
jgi:ectoine hydroxylase-related dioxygenase (phytanoyl-CoA dioxygenase family)